MSAGSTPVKVLFIAGWGRSGTTILDNVLGSHDGVFSAGELTLLWRFGVEGRTCGCGAGHFDCDLWRDVFKVAFGDAPPDPARMVSLQRQMLGKRPVPLLRVSPWVRRAEPLREYAAVLSRLYAGIATVTGCAVIVDSSKWPTEATIVGQVDGIDPYLLHMVRDPRAVAFSWQRRKAIPDAQGSAEMTRHGRLMNAAHWLAMNLGAEQAAQAFPAGRYRRLRYEDFVAHPRRSVEKIFEFLEEPATGSPFRDDRTVVLQSNHTVAGNPNRFRTGEVGLRPDDEWVTAQRPVDRYSTTAMVLPLLARYRYPIAVTGGDGAEHVGGRPR